MNVKAVAAFVIIIESTTLSVREAYADKDPVFGPEGKAKDGANAELATKIENLAMRAVYGRCSKFAVFREGSTLEADYQNYKRGWSNIGVYLSDPQKALENVLWYRVYFKGERPVSIVADKKISAELCGLPGDGVEVKLWKFPVLWYQRDQCHATDLVDREPRDVASKVRAGGVDV